MKAEKQSFYFPCTSERIPFGKYRTPFKDCHSPKKNKFYQQQEAYRQRKGIDAPTFITSNQKAEEPTKPAQTIPPKSTPATDTTYQKLESVVKENEAAIALARADKERYQQKKTRLLDEDPHRTAYQMVGFISVLILVSAIAIAHLVTKKRRRNGEETDNTAYGIAFGTSVILIVFINLLVRSQSAKKGRETSNQELINGLQAEIEQAEQQILITKELLGLNRAVLTTMPVPLPGSAASPTGTTASQPKKRKKKPLAAL